MSKLIGCLFYLFCFCVAFYYSFWAGVYVMAKVLG